MANTTTPDRSTAPYRTRVKMAHYMQAKPSHIEATPDRPYPCDMIVSYHHPRRVMPWSGLGRLFEYDVLDYNVPEEHHA